MQGKTYTKLERENKGLKIILEFPEQSDEETIHEEVKQILFNILQEQLIQI